MSVKVPLSQILAVTVKNLLMTSFGLTMGFRTVLIGGVLHDNEFQDVGESELSWLGSISLLALLVGCFGSGFVTQPLGRKRSMQFVTVPYVLCWIGFYFSTKMWHLYLVMVAMGFSSGLVEGPFNTYVSEIAQPHLRGALAISGSMSVILGVFLQFLFGTIFKWRMCALMSCAFPLLTFLLFFFVPESPCWLVSNRKLEEAKKSLAWLRGWTNVESVEFEIQGMQKRYEEEKDLQARRRSSLKNYFAAFFKSSFLRPFALVAFALIGSAFTGASTLQTYAIAIFETMELPINSYYATISLGSAQLLGVVISIFFVRYMGRRRLFFISMSCVCICNVVIAVYAHFADLLQVKLTKGDEHASLIITDSKWIPLTFLILLSFTHHCGVHSLPWILMSEVYAYETRSVGCGISSAVSSFLSFAANNLFLRVISVITIPGMYLLHSGVGFAGIFALYFYLPETEGKSLEAIVDHFAQKSKLDNKVQRKQLSVLSYGNDNSSFECDNSSKL